MTYQTWINLRSNAPFDITFLKQLSDGEYFISIDSYLHDLNIPRIQDEVLFIKKNKAYSFGGEWYCSDLILEEFFTKRVLQIHPKINLDHVTYDNSC